MPFKPPPPSLEYFYDFLSRFSRGLNEFEWRSLEHNEFHKYYQTDLDATIDNLTKLRTSIRQTITLIKNNPNYDNTQKTNS